MNDGVTFQVPFPIGAKVNIDGHREIVAYILVYSIGYEGTDVKVGWIMDGKSHVEWFPVWRLSEAQE